MKPRYEIKGEWSGPRSPAGDWTRIVHLETTRDALLAQWCDGKSIRYTDGTALYLFVRELAKGERARKNKPGYYDLIRQCYALNETNVAKLPGRP